MRGVSVALVLGSAAAGAAAPVPAGPMPDPLAWGYLGVRVDTGTVRVRDIEPGTPAARAGLQAGDELVRIGSLQPRTFDEVAEHISSFRPGSRLRVEVRRGAETKAFTVRLGVRPADLAPPPNRTRPPGVLP